MTHAPLITDRSARRTLSPRSGADVLGTLGTALAALGVAEIVLVFIPSAWGNREWEFGSVVAVMDGLPIVVLGISLLLYSLVTREKDRWVRLVGGLGMVVGVVLLVGGIAILARTVGPAFASVTDPLVRLGVQKAVGKLVLQLAISPAALMLVCWFAWKQLNAAASRPAGS